MDSYIGQIQLLAFTAYAPEGWMPCQGQSLKVASYQPLFSLIGYHYGGGGATFNLPDMRGQAPTGMQYCIVAEGGAYPVRPDTE